MSYASVMRGLILAAFLIPISVVSLAEPSGNPESEPQEAKSEQAERQPEPKPVMITPAQPVGQPAVIENNAPIKRSKGEEARDTAEEYREANLAAQTRMADAFEELVERTDAQITATYIEIFLLVWAVIAAAAAAWYAGKAAKSAQAAVEVTHAAVEVTSKTAERQLRAYIHVQEAVIHWKDNILSAQIQLRNGGQTPAYRVAFFMRIVTHNEKDFAIPGANDMHGSCDWGPGHVMTLSPEKPNIEINMWRDICSKKQPCFVWGVIRYFDTFQRERRYTNFRFTMQSDLANNNAQLLPCDDGNNSN